MNVTFLTARRSLRASRKARRRRWLLLETLERRHMLAADWQNPLFNLDVNDDSFVTPIDVLNVVNDLNNLGARQLLTPFIEFSSNAFYVDTSGDGFAAPIDALLVINSLNAALPIPTIDLGLPADNGASSTDLITNDPRIVGNAVLGASSMVSAKIRVNREVVVALPVDAAGNFNFDPRSLPDLAKGPTKIVVAITLASGGTGLRYFNFHYDATPPTFVPPHLVNADDSGVSDSDNVTKITSPHLVAEAEIGSQLVVLLNGEKIANLNSTGSWETELSSLIDGAYEISASATDLAGNISQTGFPVTFSHAILANPKRPNCSST